MKQNAVQNKRYFHGDFRSATTAPEVDTRARNYDLFVQHKTPVVHAHIHTHTNTPTLTRPCPHPHNHTNIPTHPHPHTHTPTHPHPHPPTSCSQIVSISGVLREVEEDGLNALTARDEPETVLWGERRTRNEHTVMILTNNQYTQAKGKQTNKQKKIL